jgi:hypothetical protein
MAGIAAMCLAVAAVAQTGVVKVASPEAIVGYYRFASGQIVRIDNKDGKLSIASRSLATQSLTSSPDGRFSYLSSPFHLTFDLDPTGVPAVLHLHYEELSQTAARIDDATAKQDSDAWDLKIKNQTHSPECATAVKRLIDNVRAGEPDHSKMALGLVRATRQQLPLLQPKFNELGAVREVTFVSVDQSGNEILDVTFENGTNRWRVFCLENGYLLSAGFRL